MLADDFSKHLRRLKRKPHMNTRKTEITTSVTAQLNISSVDGGVVDFMTKYLYGLPCVTTPSLYLTGLKRIIMLVSLQNTSVIVIEY
ncbi:hypothetical protein OUZ56_002062 [Daphnia magna]|uniref:Uncharacterized protein n=1 Tax=Daphnia magna TaxID=35525 RepID=A0ABR0A4K1_9CRUS|nr:hypothetical protein OUZ56_002062 [Daphnia magna]